METKELQYKLQKNETVFIYDDFEEIVVKLVPSKNETLGFIKRRGGKEYQAPQSSKIIFEAKMGGETVDEEFYKNF